MRITKTLFWIAFISGWLFLALAFFLKENHIVSFGFSGTRKGEIHEGSLDPFGALFAGAFCLLLSLFCYFIHRSSKAKYRKIK